MEGPEKRRHRSAGETVSAEITPASAQSPSTTRIENICVEGEGDGVYDVGKLTHDAKFLRIPKTMEGSYRRYTLDCGNLIVFRKV